jgi:hypothetical protein
MRMFAITMTATKSDKKQTRKRRVRSEERRFVLEGAMVVKRKTESNVFVHMSRADSRKGY